MHEVSCQKVGSTGSDIQSYIVSTSVRKHVIQGIRLRHVLCRLADDYSKLYFVVWKVFLGWLGGLRDINGCAWADEGRRRLVKENRISIERVNTAIWRDERLLTWVWRG